MSIKQRQHAFTLIELLVVIAIISLLVSLLLPSLNVARDLAKAVLCMNNQKTIGTSLAFYAQDENNYIIPANQSYYSNGLDAYWPSCLAYRGYLQYSKVYFCPSVEPLNPDLINLGGGNRMNAYGMRQWYKPGASYSQSEYGLAKPLTYIANPSDFFHLTDSYYSIESKGWYKVSPSASPSTVWVHFRHADGAVTLFGDWHVENIKDADYFETLGTRQGEYNFGNNNFWVWD